jgi:hypothetical protein
VVLGSAVSSIELDGEPFNKKEAADTSILLPAGQHVVTFYR